MWMIMFFFYFFFFFWEFRIQNNKTKFWSTIKLPLWKQQDTFIQQQKEQNKANKQKQTQSNTNKNTKKNLSNDKKLKKTNIHNNANRHHYIPRHHSEKWFSKTRPQRDAGPKSWDGGTQRSISEQQQKLLLCHRLPPSSLLPTTLPLLPSLFSLILVPPSTLLPPPSTLPLPSSPPKNVFEHLGTSETRERIIR